jgi:hypothetical protein
VEQKKVEFLAEAASPIHRVMAGLPPNFRRPNSDASGLPPFFIRWRGDLAGGYDEE